MSIKQKYEVAFQLRTLNNINIRQSCFLQVRCGVGQEKKNKEVKTILYRIYSLKATKSYKIRLLKKTINLNKVKS